MIAGFVYVLSNPAMPGLLKIGRSEVCAFDRAEQLYSSGVPAPFVVEHEEQTSNCAALEILVHKSLSELRYSAAREFFCVSVSDAVQAIREAHASEEFSEFPVAGCPAVSKAIEKIGLVQLASECGVSHQAVRKWEKGVIPAERAVQVSKIAGIPLYVLRPDLWQQEEAA